MITMTIQKGCPYSALLTITDIDGVVYNLTGKTVFFTVKKLRDFKTTDVDALITETIIAHTTPASGITTLSLDNTQTDIPAGRYKGDCRVMNGAVIVGNSQTIDVIVTNIVTKRTS
jgi:hypothetical protein